MILKFLLDYFDPGSSLLTNLESANDATLRNGQFIHAALNPNVTGLQGEILATDPNSLDESQIVGGIPAIYLLSWNYKNFTFSMMHEFMHKFRESANLSEIIFSELYEWINMIKHHIPSVFNAAYKDMIPLEVIADIIAYQTVSILLKHSNLSNDEQITTINEMVAPICGSGQGDHPNGNFRVNSIRTMSHIYNVLTDQTGGDIKLYGGYKTKYGDLTDNEIKYNIKKIFKI